MLTHWKQLRGHDEQRRLFRRSMQRGRLSHAYILSGSEGIGKRQFARLTAKSLFCRKHEFAELDACGDCRACRAFDVASWPDYIEIGVPEGRNEIPISLLVGAPERRGREGLCYELSMSPQASERRVAIINDAGQMNAESANALLKTLEEPPADSLILLVCDNPDTLLPTIRSRCQVVRFFPLAEDDVIEILLREEILDDRNEAQAVARLCEGSLEIARQLLSPDLRRLRNVVKDQLALLEKMDPLKTAATVISGIEEISSNVAEQRQNAQWLLRFVTDAIRTRLSALARGDLADPLTQRLGARQGIDVLAPLLARTVAASGHVAGSSPVKLVMEALFDELARHMRSGVRQAS